MKRNGQNTSEYSGVYFNVEARNASFSVFYYLSLSGEKGRKGKRY
jgi:hypothetical protein